MSRGQQALPATNSKLLTFSGFIHWQEQDLNILLAREN
jgi:hypothetical protein